MFIKIRFLALSLATGFCLCVVSCDQASELVDKAKGLLGDEDGSGKKASAEVDKMDELEAKKAIAEESRLLMVEFYTDT